MSLTLAVRAEQDVTVLSVGGDIDIHTAPELRNKLTELVDAGAAQIIVDLTGTDFLDSSALGTLVGANKHIEAADGLLQIVCAKPQVLRVFQITRISEVIAIFGSVDAARAAR